MQNLESAAGATKIITELISARAESNNDVLLFFVKVVTFSHNGFKRQYMLLRVIIHFCQLLKCNNFRGFKDNEEVNVIYSTPSCYIQAVNDAQPKLQLKTDDFFPYSNNEHSFWTGYFTSRPTSKRFERVGHNVLQVRLKFAYTVPTWWGKFVVLKSICYFLNRQAESS